MKRIVQASGHLLDRGVLQKILNYITEPGGRCELLEFDSGQRPGDPSRVRLALYSPPDTASAILDNLLAIGCEIRSEDDANEPDARTAPVQAGGTVPDDFYSTTNHPTYVRIGGDWKMVSGQRMDCAIVINGDNPVCTKFRDTKRSDPVVIGHRGIKVIPPARPAQSQLFCFMSAEVSSERNVSAAIGNLALEMKSIRDRAGKIVVVAGPAVIHTGGARELARLIQAGYIGGLLAGNALPAHDVEAAMFNTSLGIDLETGGCVYQGNRNHLRAINAVRLAGGIGQAVECGLITSGIFYECVRAGVPYALAGSIRDDGPLPDTEMDLLRAHDSYARLVEGADMVLILATLLHAIGTANMLPSWVRMVCVDINPATVLKLVDRGSGQVDGLVTDVGLFLRWLNEALAQVAVPLPRNEEAADHPHPR